MSNQDYIKNALLSQGDKIYKLLLEIYPQHKEIIDYHYSGTGDLPFCEWFAFLFDLDKWVLTGPHTLPVQEFFLSKTALNNLQEEYNKSLAGERFFRFSQKHPDEINFETDNIPLITAVKPDDTYRIVDGYHRWFLAHKQGCNFIRGYMWEKKPNLHPKAQEIKTCIINNLVRR